MNTCAGADVQGGGPREATAIGSGIFKSEYSRILWGTFITCFQMQNKLKTTTVRTGFWTQHDSSQMVKKSCMNEPAEVRFREKVLCGKAGRGLLNLTDAGMGEATFVELEGTR